MRPQFVILAVVGLGLGAWLFTRTSSDVAHFPSIGEQGGPRGVEDLEGGSALGGTHDVRKGGEASTSSQTNDERALRVHGIVRSKDDQSLLSGVHVALAFVPDVRRLDELEEIAATTTSSDGAFSLSTAATPRASWVQFTARGFEPQVARVPPQGMMLSIELRRASRLTVRVVDDHAAPSPLADVECHVWFEGWDARGRRRHLTGTTDADGRAMFEVGRGLCEVHVHRRGAPTVRRDLTMSESLQEVTVVCPQVSAVCGRVVNDLTGAPISGAVLEPLRRPDLACFTRADGSFELAHFVGENQLVGVTATGFEQLYVRVFSVHGPTKPLGDIRLQPGASVVGTLRGFSEPEVELVAVSAKREFGKHRFKKTLKVAGDTRFVIPSVPRGGALVVVARTSDLCAVAEAEVPEAAIGSLDAGVLWGKPFSAVSGHVKGLPEMDALVVAEVALHGVLLQRIELATKAGTYSVEGLLPGDLALWAQAGNAKGEVVRRRLEVGQHLRQDLGPGALIRGRLEGLDGDVAASSLVRLSWVEDNLIQRHMVRVEPSGAFLCAGLATNHAYAVQVIPRGVAAQGRFEPPRMDDVVPGGPELRFRWRRATWSINGQVEEALRAQSGTQSLWVQAYEKGIVRSGVDVDERGRFTMKLPGPGPFDLRLYTHDVSGEEAVLVPVQGVDALRNVVAGDAHVVIR